MDTPGLERVQRVVRDVRPAQRQPRRQSHEGTDFEEQRRKALAGEEDEEREDGAGEAKRPPAGGEDLDAAGPAEDEPGARLDITA